MHSPTARPVTSGISTNSGQRPDAIAAAGLLSRAVDFLTKRRIRISLVVIVSLIAVDMIRGASPHNVLSLSDTWTAIGLLAVLMGVFVRSWAAGVLHKDATLSTKGPYAITRNPLYLGSFLLMIGFCTLVGGVLDFVVLLLLAVLLYQPKITREEQHLAHKFGQAWSDYAKVTPRLVPRRLARGMLADWSFAQWLHNEEYQAVAGVCFGLVFFGFWFQVVN